ncbi:Ig-like domain-containing protein, partial [Winogradskyella sp.]|nr:Ig-like domain-containing protein [Winogradskyella sp.]
MKNLLLLLLFAYSSNNMFSQQKAFPNAYGGGAYASGGRMGNVYHVTNLNDSGFGSFRWALGLPRPATIVFDVSGIIDMPNPLQINGDNLTIAGQSAPEGGITLSYPSSGKLSFGDSQNVIMRYIRIRPRFQGDTALQIYPGSSEGDEASNLIFDHLSISYAGLQGFTVRGKETHNITFQNGLIAESKTGSLFGDTDPDSPGFSYDNTFRTTLFYNISHRTPNSSSGRADIYNNVVYDWKNRWTVVKTNALINHFNNYYFTGNKTSLFYQFQSQDPVWHVNGATNENPSFPPSIYTSGNIVQDLFEDPNANNQFLWIEHAFSSQTESVDPELFTASQHPMIGEVPQIMTAIEAAISVPQDAGSNKYLNADGSTTIYRDPQDTRYVNNTINDNPEPWDNSGGTDNRHTAIDQQPYADFIASITGNSINTRPENFYNPAKSEHIPEVFYDLYMPVGASHNDIAPSGYTWLEEYLNGVDGEIIDVPVVSLEIETPQNFTGLNLSETVDLDVIFNPTNATNQNGTWTTSNDGILEVNNSGNVTAVGIGVATIRFTSALDETLFDEITIDVFFSASAGEDVRVCENDDYLVELTATEGDSYLWSTAETTQSILVSPLSTQNYTVTVNIGGQESSDE